MSWDIVRAGARIEFLGSVEATEKSGNDLIEPTQLAADICRMAKKPESLTPASWDIYKIATIWLGTVGAPDKQAAVEKAAQEFKTEVWRLYAVARR
jgi:hypothetical protein